nr:L10-interacting MYB domain-containing protein-like [Aegilops tauschii subsp. strangulata]
MPLSIHVLDQGNERAAARPLPLPPPPALSPLSPLFLRCSSSPPPCLRQHRRPPALHLDVHKQPTRGADHTHEEVRANNRNGGYLSDIGQANLHKKFNERSGRNYSTRQIKNRWGVCRSEYNTWKTLIQQASGLGRDEHTHTIAATNEWWALEIKAHPEAAKFRYAPLAEEEKMHMCNLHCRYVMSILTSSTMMHMCNLHCRLQVPMLYHQKMMVP